MWTLLLDWKIRYKKYFLHCTLVFKKLYVYEYFYYPCMYNVHFQTIFSYSKTYIFTVYLLIFVCFNSSEKGSYKSTLITRSLQSKHIMINWGSDVVGPLRKELFLRLPLQAIMSLLRKINKQRPVPYQENSNINYFKLKIYWIWFIRKQGQTVHGSKAIDQRKIEIDT